MNRKRATRVAIATAILLLTTACNPLGTYLLNNSRTNAAADSGLTVADVPQLTEAWSIANGASISGQPVVAEGRVYWGDWAGVARAARVDGTTLWSQNIGSTTSCFGRIGAASSPTVADIDKRRLAFFGGGDATMYALDADTGAKVWSTRLGTSPDHFIWSSPAYYGDAIFVGVASYGACPIIRGSLVRLDAKTGAITHTFHVVPEGCVGGGIVASPALDVGAGAGAGAIYVTTGDTSFECFEPYTQSILRLKMSDLTLEAKWSVPNPDFVDADWLATPTLFTATIEGTERKLVGGPAKDGNVYVMDRDKITSGPVWSRNIAVGGADPLSGHGSISPMGFDGSTLYVGGGTTTIGTATCAGAVRAFVPGTGTVKWAACLTAPVLGAVSVASGFIVVPVGNTLVFLDSATGRTIRTWTKPGLSMFQGPVSVIGGTIYAGNTNGELIALRKGAAS